MADHEPGSMDITAQEKTFEGFMSYVSKTTIVVIAILLILAIFFR